MKINGIVFDLDHTLFDRYATIKSLAGEIYKNLKEFINDNITPEIFAENLCAADKRYITTGWTIILEELDKKGMFSKVPEFAVYLNGVRSAFRKSAVPFPFTYTVLENIRNMGLKTGIVTNGSSDLQKQKVSLLNLEKYIDEIVYAGDFERQKPYPDSFISAAERLGENPENLIFVGDHPEFDIEGARNAGFKTLWVKTGGSWNEDFTRADFELDSIEGIPALLDILI